MILKENYEHNSMFNNSKHMWLDCHHPDSVISQGKSQLNFSEMCPNVPPPQTVLLIGQGSCYWSPLSPNAKKKWHKKICHLVKANGEKKNLKKKSPSKYYRLWLFIATISFFYPLINHQLKHSCTCQKVNP